MSRPVPSRAVRRAGAAAVLCCILAAAAFSAFQPVLDNGFMRTDDVPMILRNDALAHGLSWPMARWAFTTGHASNWHPLTWLSHGLDVDLFEFRPFGHHLVNLLLHVVNAALLFLALRGMTGSLWRSFLVAAVFAVHPVQVESVAWVAERKNVLSTLFWFLAVAAHARYASRPAVGRYLPVFLLCAAGLMAKPMLVTLPFTLLILDFWPLARLGPHRTPVARGAGTQHGAGVRLVLLEKLPLIALSAASSVVTVLVQQAGRAVRTLEEYSFATRLKNALASYVQYLGKLLWPSELSPYYVHPGDSIAWLAALAAAAGLALAGWWALREVRRRPWLAAGWLWYLGVLVPVIGLVQVGNQAFADRYLYVSLIGLALAGVWSLPSSARGSRWGAIGIAGVAVLLGSLAVGSNLQARLWRDTGTLAEATLRRHPDNWLALNDSAEFYFFKPDYDAAIARELHAIRLRPGIADLRSNLATILEARSDVEGAIHHLRQAERLDPANPDYARRITELAAGRGNAENAAATWTARVRQFPGDPQARMNLGNALFFLGRYEEAAAQLQAAKSLNPAQPGVDHLLDVARLRASRGANQEELVFRQREIAGASTP